MNTQSCIETARGGDYLAARKLTELPREAFSSPLEWFRSKRLVNSATFAEVDCVRFEVTHRAPAWQFVCQTVRGRVAVLERPHTRKVGMLTERWSTWTVLATEQDHRDHGRDHGTFPSFEEAAKKAASLVR